MGNGTTRSGASKLRSLNGSSSNRMTDFDLPPIMSSRSTIHAMALKIEVLLSFQINTLVFQTNILVFQTNTLVFQTNTLVFQTNTLICETRETSISVTQLCTWVHARYRRGIMSAGTSPARQPCSWVSSVRTAGLLPKSRHHRRAIASCTVGWVCRLLRNQR